jgi:hypothetical protein
MLISGGAKSKVAANLRALGLAEFGCRLMFAFLAALRPQEDHL